jgi:hypothetical protein
MPDKIAAALTTEQWESRDYRQPARELDSWAKEGGRQAADDTTEFVAKLGVDPSGSVVLMNRAHDRVLVPPPARAALAAFALLEQPFGFTGKDLKALRAAADAMADQETGRSLRGLAARIEALLPPATSS